MSRHTVIANMHSDITFCTIFKDSSGKWAKGATVITVTIDSQEFIKTRRDNTKRDNLDNLPMF